MPKFDDKLNAILVPVLQDLISCIRNGIGEGKRLGLSNLLLITINSDISSKNFDEAISTLPEQAKLATHQLNDLYREHCPEESQQPIVQIISIRYLVASKGQRYEKGTMQQFVKWYIKLYCEQLLRPEQTIFHSNSNNETNLALTAVASKMYCESSEEFTIKNSNSNNGISKINERYPSKVNKSAFFAPSAQTSQPVKPNQTDNSHNLNENMELQIFEKSITYNKAYQHLSLDTAFLLNRQQGLLVPPVAANAVKLFSLAEGHKQNGNHLLALQYNTRALALQHYYQQREQVNFLLQRTEILMALGKLEQAEECLNLVNLQFAEQNGSSFSQQNIYPNRHII